jgi:hypothetical protein
MNLKSAQQQFREEGYLVYPGVFAGPELDRLLAACNRVLDQHTAEWDRENSNKDFMEMRHLNDPRWHRHNRDDFKLIMELIADPRCLGPVEQIFGEPSLFRCTSYFVNPRFGSLDGNWHRDTQFITKTEEEERALVKKNATSPRILDGVQFQIPLVDSEDIEYVPFSAARYDSPEEYYIRCADNRSHNREPGMPNALRLRLRAGDGAIFNANGLHRGRYHTDKHRRTLMLTYTPLSSPNEDFFSHQAWFTEPGHLAGLSPRAQAFFNEFITTYRKFWATARPD